MTLVSVAALLDRRYDVCKRWARLELVELDENIFEEVVGLVWMNEKAKEMKEMAQRSSKLGFVKKQIELGLLGSSKGRIQLAVSMNLLLKFRNKEKIKEIQDLSQSLDMTNDDSRENRREPTTQ
ncbi:hypothetical protein PPACK8108_LOCUS17222 [Phakopsora pachyrhizi]|uniref:Uncharacterized protein n=1 Tax=Phakopsora pachyrhizi TaxID=170000 RepID=A0AAV0B8Z9_PHAPC|nr:hypothetical protein PPACK8108_LOCUS17222 [Phakopsora pachyrhizi]